LTTFDTVGSETPASAAMTASVVRPTGRFPVVRAMDAPSPRRRGTVGTVAALSGACSLLDGTPTLSRPFSRNSFDNDIVNYTDAIVTRKLMMGRDAQEGGQTWRTAVSERYRKQGVDRP
jgi:hypothetical protein